MKPSLRFEVLKRDRFTCCYCGRTPPTVLLAVDHVTPKAAGGGDEIDNLVTACTECNAGKGSRMLEEGQAPSVNTAAIEEAQERVEQLRAYRAIVLERDRILEEDIGLAVNRWARAFDADLDEEGTHWCLPPGVVFPEHASLAYFLRNLPLDEVYDAIDRTGAKCKGKSNGADRYFYAICHNKIRDARDGRV